MPGTQECLGDEARAAARIQHERVGRKRREGDEPRQRRRIGLHGRKLEASSLPVEGIGQRPFMGVHDSCNDKLHLGETRWGAFPT